MAFPILQGTATSLTDPFSTNHTVSLPATVNAGDTLIVQFVDRGSTTVSFPAGWTKIFQLSNANLVTKAIAWKKADGTEGGTTINVTTDSAQTAVHAAYVIDAAADPAITAPEASTGATGADAADDSDSLTPIGGVKDYLWFTFVGRERREQHVSGDEPVSYTFVLSATSVTAVEILLASARRDLNALSEDPGAWTNGRNEVWVACTVAIHPVGVTAASTLLRRHPMLSLLVR